MLRLFATALIAASPAFGWVEPVGSTVECRMRCACAPRDTAHFMDGVHMQALRIKLGRALVFGARPV